MRLDEIRPGMRVAVYWGSRSIGRVAFTNPGGTIDVEILEDGQWMSYPGGGHWRVHPKQLRKLKSKPPKAVRVPRKIWIVVDESKYQIPLFYWLTEDAAFSSHEYKSFQGSRVIEFREVLEGDEK